MKMFDEVCGYVVVDYQDYLEEQWVEELCEIYEVDINCKVFKKFIKEQEVCCRCESWVGFLLFGFCCFII